MEVMTVVEGKLPKSKMRELELSYSALRDQPKPRGLMMSMLLRDASEEGLYRISTLWQDRQSLDEMRKVNKVPAAVALFKSQGVEPTVRIFDVAISIKA
jgi:quinol monooxygenase YgiN